VQGIELVNQYLMILWRRGWIIALVFLGAVAVAAAILVMVPPRYDAEATASIDPGFVDPITQTGGMGSTSMMQGNMLELVRSQRVALDVVKRLNLQANPMVQAQYQKSGYLGRESIQDWYAAVMAKYVRPSFVTGSNVLSIRFGSADPNLAALVANAFLAASVDAAVSMKAAAAEQTAQWFAPQLADLRRELADASASLEKFQSQSNVALPTGEAADKESTELTTVTNALSTAKANLVLLQNQLSNDATDLSVDPSDPDLQLLASLKQKLSEAQVWVESSKGSLGANNPKVAAEQSMIASIQKQIPDATARAKDKARKHLNDRIAQTQSLIASLEAEQASAQKALIASQARRNQLQEHYRDVRLRVEQLEAEQKMADQAKLHSKLTFADIANLDRAVPPIEPSFPNPFRVIVIALGAGLALGVALALGVEALDRRVRDPFLLEMATSAATLAVIPVTRRASLLGGPRRLLRAT
jgi:polysaccharide biosynthesis transport protein